ncbi:hypothetical protein F5148DRAFT_572564 [Russula earlei]|uniref:Uncharacterized protein n=1 Tax=Russula earlei TaxID=71964 RepID=A0ACC0UHJ7_9AGAM|nr:hypothetical protein F5148DRAFT_572564 [Russula earlei]
MHRPVRHSSLRIALHSVVYMAAMGMLFPSLAIVYLHNCSNRATHSVPDYVAPTLQWITEPYECRSDGNLDFCVKDGCNLRWKPPGTHHCSTCGTCRIGFDHHCPWVSEAQQPSLSCVDAMSCKLGNCVTTGRLKAFLALLVLTSVTVPLASLPVLPILKRHITAALAASHADAWATNIWWSRPYSWILCGGPPGRWAIGTLLGFRTLRERRIPEASWLSGSLVVQPHARMVILVGIGILFWLFAISMTVVVAVNVTKGQRTMDTVLIRLPRPGRTAASTSRFICIPYSHPPASLAYTSAVRSAPAVPENCPEPHGTQRIYPIPISHRIYDHGWRENWRGLLAQPLFNHGTPYQGVYKWPKMNPEVIRRLLGS